MPAIERPNIVFIMTDQQSATMMGCAGNPWVSTPNMDRLAAAGVRFERAYCCNPVCVPSRFSMMTGRFPSAIGQKENRCDHIDSIPESILSGSMGRLLRDGGYETVYAGKQHLPKMTAEHVGFRVLAMDERDACADTCAAYLHEDHDAPFLLVSSFINPHDICYMAIRDSMESDHEKALMSRATDEIAALDDALRLPDVMDEETFFATVCPPLPPNFEPAEDEPEAVVDLLKERGFRWKARREYGEREWRMHRWAYARLTERVDLEIGRVLEAIDDAGLTENTVVVFTSDHGDHDGSRRMEHKDAAYEEAARIPFVVRAPGMAAPGTTDDAHLVSNGLDLLPTFCDYAGVTPPSDLAGRSIRPLLEGDEIPWRESLMVESQIGRMLRVGDLVYMIFDHGANREQLFDLADDPHQQRNLAADPARADDLRACRRRLSEWIDRVDDRIGREYAVD